MNIFCQAESNLPQNGDMAVWNAATMRWEFQAAAATGGNGGYAVGEWKDWYELTPPAGWKERDGQVLPAASVNYPELLAWLERPENGWKLKTEAEWQALRDAAGGIGGAWFYVLDQAADTIRLPDTRGDFVRDAGGRKGDDPSDGVYGVGEWHGDAIRNIEGSTERGITRSISQQTGAMYEGAISPNCASVTEEPNPSHQSSLCDLHFDASRVVPTAHENRPRAGMLLGCVYVGR